METANEASCSAACNQLHPCLKLPSILAPTLGLSSDLKNETLQAAVNNIRAACLHQQAYVPVAKRLAAVLIPLFEDAEGTLRVVLCQRASGLSTHAGEVSLPGGKRDDTDRDDIHTALREAEEELGIREVEVLGQLKPILSKHRLSVTPVLGKIKWPLTFQSNPAEVAAVFDVPLNMFLSPDPAVYSFRDTEKAFGPGLVTRLHFFDYKGYNIWGLTSWILIQAARVAFRRDPDFVFMPGDREYTDIEYDDEAQIAFWRSPTADTPKL